MLVRKPSGASAAAAAALLGAHRALPSAARIVGTGGGGGKRGAMCSCSPTAFAFVLDLDRTCENNDIEDGDGVDGSFCSMSVVEEEAAVPGREYYELDDTGIW